MRILVIIAVIIVKLQVMYSHWLVLWSWYFDGPMAETVFYVLLAALSTTSWCIAFKETNDTRLHLLPRGSLASFSLRREPVPDDTGPDAQ